MNHLRITEILRPFSGLWKVAPWILVKAGERGRKVHDAVEAHLKGLPIDIEPEYKGFVESFLKWWKDDGREIEEIERRYYCDELEITGQIDLLVSDAKNPHSLTLIDFKSSLSPSVTWIYQAAAYRYLVNLEEVEKERYLDHIMIVHLKKNGAEPTVYSYPIQQLNEAWEVFKCCLTCYKVFFQGEEEPMTEEL